jgi:hypothetical protein
MLFTKSLEKRRSGTSGTTMGVTCKAVAERERVGERLYGRAM